MNIIAQFLGVGAIIVWVLSIGKKDKKVLLEYQGIANVIYGVEYLLLGAYSASILNFITTVRSGVFYYQKKPLKITLMIFMVLIIILGVITYTDFYSIIPIVINLLYAYSVWQDNRLITIWVYIGCACIWLFYNFHVGAYISIVGNVLEIIAGFISYKKK